MRILHLISSGGIYGAERILLYLAREQQRRGTQAFVGSIAAPGAKAPELEKLAASYELRVLPLRIPRLPSPGAVRSLLAAAKGVNADVLHSHGFKANVLLGPLSRRTRPPMLSTLHGWTASQGLSLLALYERLDRIALRRIDSVIVVTRSMLQLPAVRALPVAKVHLIENGLPPKEARLADLAASEVAPLPEALVQRVRQRRTLLAIGRLSAEKGFAELIEAFAQVHRDVPSYQLVIVGDGAERAALQRRIAALRLESDIYLAGYIEGPDRLLEHAAGFVMSSHTEGMPLVLLEAMQWRAPIMATAVGAIPELLDQGRGGELVPPGDVAELARGLLKLLEGSVPPSGGAESAARYSSARMAEEYQRAYEAIT